mmetsp:Transcript_1364/g.2860  ORF Transcript_1364/g.2860 Transcript_1364/m.2860 type:complete len:200 (-) Transcript_1364:25-624(-)
MLLNAPKALLSRPRSFSNTGCSFSIFSDISGSAAAASCAGASLAPRWMKDSPVACAIMLLKTPKVLLSKPRNFSSTGCKASNFRAASGSDASAPLGRDTWWTSSPRCSSDALEAWLNIPLRAPKAFGSKPRSFSRTGCKASNRCSVVAGCCVAAAGPSPRKATPETMCGNMPTAKSAAIRAARMATFQGTRSTGELRWN